MNDIDRMLRLVAEVSGRPHLRLPLSVVEELVLLEGQIGAKAFRQRLEEASGKVRMGIRLADYIRLTISDNWARLLGVPIEPRPAWWRTKWTKPKKQRSKR